MTIDPIPRKSIPELVAGKLAASILDKDYLPAAQLPSERDLIKELGVSRSSLREALKIISEADLIKAQQGVGWFVADLNSSSLLEARQLTADIKAPKTKSKTKKTEDSSAGAVQ